MPVSEAVFVLVVLLGIAMPLKYAMQMPIAVQVMGPVHGILFLAYVFMTANLMAEDHITRGLAARMVIASFLPFGPFMVDRELKQLSVPTNPRP